MKIPKPRKLKSGRWFIQLRLGGESYSITTDTEKDCITQAQKVKAEYLAGERLRKSSNITLAAAIDKYISDRENTKSPSTIKGYKDIRAQRFQDYMNKPIKSINWQAAINLESKTVSPKTIKNTWGFIKSVLKENGIDVSVINVALPEIPKTERPYLEPDEILVFLEAIKGQPCEIPALLALSSLRKSELLGLTWDNVDLQNRVIHIRGASVRGDNGQLIDRKQNKNTSSTRDVPMIPQLYDALMKVENKTGKVITCHYQTPYKQIRALSIKAGLPAQGLHSLRHSFASLAYHLGLSELETMRIGGWSDFGTMRRIYTHLSSKDAAKAENKFTQFFENANKNANQSH